MPFLYFRPSNRENKVSRNMAPTKSRNKVRAKISTNKVIIIIILMIIDLGLASPNITTNYHASLCHC